MRDGNLEKAKGVYNDVLSIAQELGDWRRLGLLYSRFGLLHAELKEYETAIKYYNKALVGIRSSGVHDEEAGTLVNLGTALKKVGEKEAAKDAWKEAYRIFQEIGSPRAQWIKGYIDSLDNDSNINISTMIDTVIVATKNGDKSEKQNHFDTLTHMASDSSLRPEVRELALILKKIMVGVKKPDLSKLPKEIAEIVQKAIEDRWGTEGQ
jgi:tetratricopeptide (TPR) repeat protein